MGFRLTSEPPSFTSSFELRRALSAVSSTPTSVFASVPELLVFRPEASAFEIDITPPGTLLLCHDSMAPPSSTRSRFEPHHHQSQSPLAFDLPHVLTL
ncbi:hypothetical protein D9757_011528 [Collybiopsis confluens]|uniref:Uncharacterized protein n=1 Tax=Collybiopsis confluens TaxID=2823264 RepID=A0A8H5H7W1_9AGAR|nr:hypothetical protein D9757_011528 [Collybiopsis confluens]